VIVFSVAEEIIDSYNISTLVVTNVIINYIQYNCNQYYHNKQFGNVYYYTIPSLSYKL